MHTMSIKLHPNYNNELLDIVMGYLDSAVEQYPGNFSQVQNVPGTIDHYGYHDTHRSAVLFSQEYNSLYYCLRIPDISHPVLDNLAHLIANALNEGRN